MLEKSVTATNLSRTVCPRKADTSYAGLCTQPEVALRLEKVASVASSAPLEGLTSVTVIWSYTVVEVVSSVLMRYQNCTRAALDEAGMVTSWKSVSVPLSEPPSHAYQPPACAMEALLVRIGPAGPPAPPGSAVLHPPLGGGMPVPA